MDPFSRGELFGRFPVLSDIVQVVFQQGDKLSGQSDRMGRCGLPGRSDTVHKRDTKDPAG